MENSRLRYLLWVFVFYMFLGVVGTYPLIFHMSDHFTENQMSGGFAGCDTLQTYYKFWLFKQTVLDGGILINNDFEFSIGSYQKHIGLLGFPLTPFFFILSFMGEITAYNFLVILSFPFAGLGMYLLVEFLTKNKYSGMVAGLFYTLVPFRVGEIIIYGHRGGFIALLLPFIVYFIERSFVEKNPKSMVWAGICILMVSFSEWHIMYYVLLFTCLYVPFKLHQLDKDVSIGKKIREYSPILVVLSVFLLLSVSYIMFNKYQGSGLTEFSGWDRVTLTALSPPLIYFLIKDPMNECYLGIVALTLTITLLVYLRKLAGNPDIWFYVLVFMGSAALALGPVFPSDSFSLYGIFYDFMPYFDHFRSPVRVTIMTVLALSVLLGFSIDKVSRFAKKTPRKEMLVFMSIIMVFLSVDLLMAPISLTPADEDNRVYQVIRDDPRDLKVLEIPIFNGGYSVGAVYEYYITVHEKKTINGYNPFPPQEYIKLRSKINKLNQGELNSPQYHTLKENGVGYVVVHEDLFSYIYPDENSTAHINCTNGLLESQYLEFVEKEGDVWLFYVK